MKIVLYEMNGHVKNINLLRMSKKQIKKGAKIPIWCLLKFDCK